MSTKELQQKMSILYQELNNSAISNTSILHKQIIAKAVQLGMKFQEEKIKEGIDIVFNSLNKNIA